MNNNEIEWADLTGYGLHLKTFYFKNIFGFNNDTIGTINLLIDTTPVIRIDKAKTAGLICLVGQPSHNIYEDVDVNKPETLLMSPSKNPPNLFQIPTTDNVIIEPAKFISQLGLPLGRYRKVSATQAEVDRLFFKMAAPILNQIKLMLQAQFPYIKNEADIQIVSGPFGHYLTSHQESIDESGQIELLQTEGNLKDSSISDYLSNRLIHLYRHNPLSTADINNIIDFSCRKQPEFRSITIDGQKLIEPIMPTADYKASTEQLFYFSEFIKGRWTTNIQEIFLKAALEDSYSKVQIEQQSRTPKNEDDFKSKSMVLPQSQDWLLDLCESDKNNPFHQKSVQSDLNSYKTPLFVAYQISRLLSVDGMHEPIDTKPSETPVLLDMTAGFGNLWPFLSNCSITAFENNSNTYQYLSSVSRMFNHLRRDHEFLPRIHDIINENVLTTSLSSSAHGDDLGYDYILATPDFARTNNSVTLPFPDSKGAYHFEVKSDRLDHHVAILGLQHLKQHGRMVFLLDVEKPQAVSRMESYFYQYIYTYFNVDLIVEMSAGLFYGSGHEGNVRMHVIAGKREAPVDESEIIERTQKALSLAIPIVLNDRQLNNVVQHYITKKYEVNRFDKLISNDATVPVRVGATPEQKEIDDLFVAALEDTFETPFAQEENQTTFFKALLYKQVMSNASDLIDESKLYRQINVFFKSLSYTRSKDDQKYRTGSPLQPPMAFTKKVAVFFSALIGKPIKPKDKDPVVTSAHYEQLFKTLVFESTSKEQVSAPKYRFIAGMHPIDVLDGAVLAYAAEDISALTTKTEPLKTTTEQPIEDSHTLSDATVDDGEVTGDNESSVDSSDDTDDTDGKDDDADSKDGDDTPAENEDTGVDAPLLEDEGDGIEGVDNRYGEEDDDDDDEFEEFGGSLFDDDDDFDPDAALAQEEQGFGKPLGKDELPTLTESKPTTPSLTASLLSALGDSSDDFDSDEDPSGSMLQDQLLPDEDSDTESPDSGSQSVSSSASPNADFLEAYERQEDLDREQENQLNKEESEPKQPPKPTISANTDKADNDDDAGKSETDSSASVESNEADGPNDSSDGVNEEPEFVSTAKKLQSLDAIENLRQARLARINMSRPQTLALVKQSSLTSKATGYVPRLIENTQLNLYQQVPKMANDLFSLTSNIDAWLYKTFNLNFKASQSIFGLLPDFAKHAAAYYCTEQPPKHVIFDVSRRSQYLISCLVILFKVKEMAVGGVKHTVSVGYGADTDFIELIAAFKVLASAVGVKYEKHTNPVEQVLELISSLMALSLGGSTYDINSIFSIGDIEDVIEATKTPAEPSLAGKPFLLLIGDDFISTSALINDSKKDKDQWAFDHLAITSYDIFDVDSLPNLSSSFGANGVFEFLPYYITDKATLLPDSLLGDKRLFFYLYEVCLKKASHLGLIQYHYEPLTYADLPVRLLKEPLQEGLPTLLDTFYHLTKHLNAVDLMTSKIGAAPHCDYRSATRIIDEYLAMTKIALNAASIKNVIADNYKNGKHSTLPVVTNYSYLIAEYLLYTNHRSDFIDYYQDPTLDASTLLLKLTNERIYNNPLSTNTDLTPITQVLDEDDFLPIVSTLHPDQDLVSHGYSKVNTDRADFPGYRCPNLKDLIEFVAKRVSMIAVQSNNTTQTKLESAEIYGVKTNKDTRTVLCDGSTLLSGANEQAFIQRVDIVRKFVSMIPKNDISAIPFENAVYELARTGIACEYISPNSIKYVISSVTSNGIDDVLRLNVEADKRSVFNFSDEIYTAANDATIIDMGFAYHPYIGIAPTRYNRHTTTTDHFRQRSVIISEFLPPKTIKELVFKLSVPAPDTHNTAMVVTDYIDVDFALMNFYGDFNETIITSAMKLAGCNVSSEFDSTNHNHYLAMLDMLCMPQTIKIGLQGNISIHSTPHAQLIDTLYEPIKKIADLDGGGQTSALEVLFKYVKAYQPLHPNNHSWFQSLFYTNYELKAMPVYSGMVASEDVYPTVFEYQHITEFTPSVATLTVTARHFVREQFSTIENFINEMTDDAKLSYYDSATNDVYESFIALPKPMQMAYIYSAEFRKQNTHAFKAMVFSEFGINLNKSANVTLAINKIKSPALSKMYDNMVTTNKLIVNSANFIATAIESRTRDDVDVFILKDFAMDVAASSNNVDADAFFYGYNHTASNLRSNKRQLYAMALGLLLPEINFTKSNQPRFMLLLLKHLSYVAITNQHDRLIFLSKDDLESAWSLLGDKNKLIISPKSDELSPFYPDSDEEVSTRDKLKAESGCKSYSKAFTASDTDVNKSVFSIMDESDLVAAVHSRQWASVTGAYDVIRFSNNTNHYFIHIVEKTATNN